MIAESEILEAFTTALEEIDRLRQNQCNHCGRPQLKAMHLDADGFLTPTEHHLDQTQRPENTTDNRSFCAGMVQVNAKSDADHHVGDDQQ